MQSWLSCIARQQVEANVIVYNAGINALGKGKQWKLGLGLMTAMGQQGCSTNTITCNALLSACERSSAWNAALRALDLQPGWPGKGATTGKHFWE